MTRRPLPRRNFAQAVAEVVSQPCTTEVLQLVEFIRSSTRGVCVGTRRVPALEPLVSPELR